MKPMVVANASRNGANMRPTSTNIEQQGTHAWIGRVALNREGRFEGSSNYDGRRVTGYETVRAAVGDQCQLPRPNSGEWCVRVFCVPVSTRQPLRESSISSHRYTPIYIHIETYVHQVRGRY